MNIQNMQGLIIMILGIVIFIVGLCLLNDYRGIFMSLVLMSVGTCAFMAGNYVFFDGNNEVDKIVSNDNIIIEEYENEKIRYIDENGNIEEFSVRGSDWEIKENIYVDEIVIDKENHRIIFPAENSSSHSHLNQLKERDVIEEQERNNSRIAE